MARPDPQTIAKRPQARAGARPRDIAVGPPRAVDDGLPLSPFAADGRLDLDAICKLIDLSPVLLEGRIYEATGTGGAGATGPVFLGTALLTVDLTRGTWPGGSGDEAVRGLRDALARDRRVVQLLRDRAWRETARLLGPDAPDTLEVAPTLRAEGGRILIDLDLEGPVSSAPPR